MPATAQPPPMLYLDKDVAYFVSSSPCLALAEPREAARFLLRHIAAGEECAPALRAYPGLRIEPLEFFYTCLQNLGALDLPFFEALLRDHTWRGVVWGSWLALLEPRREFASALREVGPRWPHNQWIVECAIAAVEGRASVAEHEGVAALAERFRRLLEGLSRPMVPLRRRPAEEEIARMDREREQIRECYERLGAEAALGCLPGTAVGFYAQDYVRWRRSLRG